MIQHVRINTFESLGRPAGLIQCDFVIQNNPLLNLVFKISIKINLRLNDSCSELFRPSIEHVFID